tara:strand:- start:7793 stop:8122 length:330 start_codon:yes stop_codon:yes gene_type:complete
VFNVGCEKCGAGGELLFSLPGNMLAKVCISCRNDALAWITSTDAYKRCTAWAMQYEAKLFKDFDSALKISSSWIKEEEEVRRILKRWLQAQKVLDEHSIDFSKGFEEDL